MFSIDLIPNFNFVCGLLSIFLVNYLIKSLIKLWRLPPGPWGLPIVGYLPFIKKDTHLQFTDFYKKYGSVFSLRIGSFDVVVINGWPAIKEAFASDNLLARPTKDYFTIIGDASLLEMSGDDWREQRRVALTTLRNVGLGKTRMEETIKEEINCFIEKLKSQKIKSVVIHDLLSESLTNTISILLFGHKFDYDDLRKNELDFNLNKLQADGAIVNMIFFMPWITKLILRFKLISLTKFIDALEGIGNVIIEEINEHTEKQQDNEIDDYIDGFLQEMKKRSNDDKTTFTTTTLKRNATTFYSAGSDTIRESLKWMFKVLAAYPEYQIKIREEINGVLGSERAPDNVDRQRMPYTMAFLYEALRFSTIGPINIARWTTKDTIIDGKLIPKDTIVFLNFWSVHRDPDLYPDPEKFDPTRFLNEDQSKAIKHPHLIPFSGGKRVCPGESLAYLQLFLYLVNILQKFDIKPESEGDVSLEGDYTFIRVVKGQFKLIFTPIKS